jgi:thiol-disulfide isomerase/thioredoxin
MSENLFLLFLSKACFTELVLFLQEVVCNGRPTVVDFFAEWCSDCKRLAPALRKAEQLLRDRVNFVTLNGDAPANGNLGKWRTDHNVCAEFLYFNVQRPLWSVCT